MEGSGWRKKRCRWGEEDDEEQRRDRQQEDEDVSEKYFLQVNSPLDERKLQTSLDLRVHEMVPQKL